MCNDSQTWQAELLALNPNSFVVQHEEASTAMFDYLIEANQLMEAFAQYGLTEKDISFIKEQIAGPLDKKKVGLRQEY